MVKKARKKVSSYATGGPSATAQGLPSPSPVGGFTQGPESNQFGSWGAAVEQGGIPGSTEGLQQVGNQTTPFNPGDQVAAQGIAAPAPNVQSTYYAPISPPVTATASQAPTQTAPPPPPAAAPPPAPATSASVPAETSAQGWASQGYVMANGQEIYNPTLAQQYLQQNPIGRAAGGVIPAYEGGGIAPETTIDPNAGLSAQGMANAQQQVGQIMNSPQMQQGVQRAVDMAKKSFGIDLPSAASLLGNTRPTAAQSAGPVPAASSGSGGSQMEQANNRMQAAISGMQRHAKGGGVPAYNAGGDAIDPRDPVDASMIGPKDFPTLDLPAINGTRASDYMPPNRGEIQDPYRNDPNSGRYVGTADMGVVNRLAHGGGVPTYDDGGNVSSDSGGGGGGYGGGDTTQATSEPAPASITSQAPASDDRSLFQKAVAYFSGAGAMAQDQFNALKQRVIGDQTQGASPTKQNMAVLDAAAELGPEVASGAVQHLKAQYEPRRMQAARALEAGHLDVGAKDATDAMGFVPDAHEVSFIPHQNGVSAIIQDPEGKTSKADFPAPSLAGLLKSSQAIWDNVTQNGAKSIFGQAPEQSNQFGAVGRGLSAIQQGTNPLSTEPTFAKTTEDQTQIADKDRPYGRLNPKVDEAGGAGGGFGGPPGPPVQGKETADVQQEEQRRAAQIDTARADTEWAAHQRQALSTDQRRPAALGTISPRAAREYNTAQRLAEANGQRGFQVEAAPNTMPSEFGERLPNGGRRLGPSLNMAAVPPNWRTAPDEHGGWVALPPGVTPKPVDIKMWTTDGNPVNVRGFDHWDPNRLKWAQTPNGQGGFSSQEVFPNPPQGVNPNTPAQRTIPGANYPELTGRQPSGIVSTHSSEPDVWDKQGHPLHYSPRDRYFGGGYELNAQALNPAAVPTGGNQAGRGQQRPPVDRSQVTGTAQAQMDQRQIHDYITGLYHRREQGEQLSDEENQDLQTYNESARQLLSRRQPYPQGSNPITIGGGGNYPRLTNPAQREKLPATTPYYYDPNGVLRHNPNYRGQ